MALNKLTRGLNQLSQAFGSRLGGSGAPVAPAGSVFAVAIDPSTCRYGATFGTSVPCIAGVGIQWIQELVSGVWYEQATGASQLILRASGSKWYAEGDTGRSHTMTLTWPGGTNGTICQAIQPIGSTNARGFTHLPGVDAWPIFATTTYPGIFRSARVGPLGTIVAGTAWNIVSTVSGAAYQHFINNVQIGTDQAVSWQTPTSIVLGSGQQCNVSSCAIYANSTSRAAGESWLAGITP